MRSEFLPGEGVPHFTNHNEATDRQVMVENNISIPHGAGGAGGAGGASFDPMLLKVVAAADTREEVLSRMEAALRRCQIVGVPTNIQMLVNTLRLERFRRDGADSRMVEEEEAVLLKRPVPTCLEAVHSIAVWELLKSRRAEKTTSDPWAVLRGFCSSGDLTRYENFSVNGARYECRVTTGQEGCVVSVKREGEREETALAVAPLSREGEKMVVRVGEHIVTSFVKEERDAVRVWPVSCTELFGSGSECWL